MAQQTYSRLMHLRCVDIYVISVNRRRHIEVIDEAAADFEENLDTVDEEKHNNDEKKDGIALEKINCDE